MDVEQGDLKALLFKLLEGVQHRVVLELGGYKVLFALDGAELRHGNDSLIIRLGAAGGEVDFSGLRADYVGNGLSRRFKGFLCLLREAVQARRIAIQSCEVWHHYVNSGLADGGGRRVICINKHFYLPFVYPINSVGIVTLYCTLVNSFLLSPFVSGEQIL